MLSIDITDKRISIVKGTGSASKARVTFALTRDIPDGYIINGYIADFEAFTKFLKNLIFDNKLKTKGAVVTISSSTILNKILVLPYPKSLKNSMAIEAMIVTNMGISKEYNLSYIITRNFIEEDGKKIECIVSACPQKLVDGYNKVFSSIGVPMKQLSPANMAVIRLVLRNKKFLTDMPLLAVQVDENFLNLTLFENGNVTFSHYVQLDDADYKDDASYINQAVYDNIFYMMQFMGTRKDSRPLKNIIFFGIINDFLALTNAIASFQVPALLSPVPHFVSIHCDLEFHKYLNAIGMMTEADPILEKLNVMHSSAVKQKAGLNRIIIIALLLVIFAAEGVWCMWYFANQMGEPTRAEIAAINAKLTGEELAGQIAEMQSKINVLNTYVAYSDKVGNAKSLFDRMPKANTKVISELEDLLLPGMKLTDVVTISGYNVSASVIAKNQEHPSAYVKALTEKGFFENITYNGYEEVSGQYAFSLTMLIKGEN